MKSKLIIPLLGFMVFLMAVSCTEPIEVNPNYNSETKEVTTQFVISVNTGTPQTKMPASAVQQDNKFRGINSGHILLFKSYDETTTPKTPLNYVFDSSLKAEKDYPFGVLISSGEIVATNNQTSDSNRILEMSVPTGVNVAMIYGIAPKEKGHNEEGHIVYTVSDLPSGTSFALCRRIGDTEDDITAYDQTGSLMAFVINRILASNCAEFSNTETPYAGVYTYLSPISWRELGILYENNNEHLHGTTIPFGGVTTTRSLTALEESLGRAYSEFTYIKPGEYRAGSSGAIKKMMQDMFDVVAKIANAIPGNAAEANAKRLAATIETRINDYFDNSWLYKENDLVKSVIINNHLKTETEWTSEFGKAKDLNGYPYEDFNIPVGAAQLTFDKDNGVIGYKHPNQALLSAGVDYDPRNYTYPAELVYFVNSPLRISSKSKLEVSDFVDGVTPWQDNAEWLARGWNNDIGAVEQSTRGVAVRDNISYGVALLKTTLSYADGVTEFSDNRKEMTGEADRTFSTANAKLTLRAVLIGGQNAQMDWQFLRKNTAANSTVYSGGDALIDPSLFNRVIYDDKLPSTSVPMDEPNYTLVFDNYNSSETTQNTVKVALEFKNGGDAFWGKDNLIPKDGIFYLVGELVPANAKTAVNWATATRQIPPVYLPGETLPSGSTKKVGDSKEIARVFIQDYMTIANFKLNTNSLKHAYLTIPDMRSAQMSFGLSVDLKWKQGFEFDVNL